MKAIALTMTAAVLLMITASLAGIVGCRYPHVLEDEPLNNPIHGIRIDGSRLYLSDLLVKPDTASDRNCDQNHSNPGFECPASESR